LIIFQKSFVAQGINFDFSYAAAVELLFSNQFSLRAIGVGGRDVSIVSLGP
jgi:hypothetical protein